MRGWDVRSEALFSYVSCAARVPLDHPLRPIRQIVDEALAALQQQRAKQLLGSNRRPSKLGIELLKLRRQAFYSVRSERQLMEQLGYTAIDGRTTRHPGYAVSGRVRKRIEEVFGWTKAAAG
jgi:hypothetical protein